MTTDRLSDTSPTNGQRLPLKTPRTAEVLSRPSHHRWCSSVDNGPRTSDSPVCLEVVGLEVRHQAQKATALDWVTQLLGKCPSIGELRRLIRRTGPKNVSVLITGPTGSGKELIAKALHEESQRSDQMVMVDCPQIVGEVGLARVTGQVEGSFSGAVDRLGALEQADNGTVYWHEIGDLPPDGQAQILGLLERHAVQRIGTSVERQLNIRFVASTNHPERLRPELLNRFDIELVSPPLSGRGSDVPLLAKAFLKHDERFRGDRKTLTQPAIGLLLARQRARAPESPYAGPHPSWQAEKYPSCAYSSCIGTSH